jgi:hypothetical protein
VFLARKINRAKWPGTEDLSAGEIPADAVTVDLRTQGNALSFWQCPTDTDSGVVEAALAIAAAGNRLEKLDIVWLADEELQSDGQTLIDTEGRTPVTDMVAMHVDVSRLDYVRLGRVARRVVDAIKADRFCRLTKARVKSLIEEAVGEGRIDRSDLHDKLREQVAS